MVTKSRFTSLAAVLAVALTTTTVLAGSGNEEQARATFREGVALYDRGDHRAALEKFRAAYRLWQNPMMLPSLGSAAWKSGELAEAADAYARYLDEAPADAADRPSVDQGLAQLTPKVASLAIRQRVGDGAQITVDGRPVDAARLGQVFVNPGQHIVAASSPTGKGEKTIDVAAGQRLGVVVEREADATSKRNGAENAPAATPSTSRISATESIAQDNGASSSGGTAVPWIIGGVGLVSLGASGVFFLMRQNAVNDLEKECFGNVCDTSSQDTLDRANTFGTVSLITLGVGVVGVGVGLGMLIAGSGSDEPNKAQVGLEIGPGGSTMLRLGAKL